MKLGNIKVGTKLVAGFLIVAGFVAVVGMIGLQGMNTIMSAADHLMDVSAEMADAAMESNIAMLENRDMLAEIMRSDDLSEVAAAEAAFVENYAVFTEEVSKIIDLGDSKVSSLGSDARQVGETFRQAGLSLLQAQREAIEHTAAVAEAMEGFDEAAGDISSSLEEYEASVTGRDGEVTGKAHDAMEAIIHMLEQKAVGEEFAGLTDTAPVKDLRGEFDMSGEAGAKYMQKMPQDVRNAYQRFAASAIAMFDAKTEELKHLAEADEAMENADASGERLTGILETAEKEIEAGMEVEMAAADETHASARKFMIAITIAGFLLACGLGIVLARSITTPLGSAVSALEKMSQGDLTATIEVTQTDEIGQMLSSMKAMVEKLSITVADVKAAADNVAAGSEQVSSSTEELSQGATEQASSAEEASSSMEEMASNIRQNADNAQQTEKTPSRRRRSPSRPPRMPRREARRWRRRCRP
jgi:methyl-accepting chemotaxis protein